MLAKRIPFLLVFAGGCLSGAVLIGFVGAAPERAAAPKRAVNLDRAPAGATQTAEGGEHDGEVHRAAPELVVSPPHDAEGAASESSPEGSSLAEVLARWEATYRAGLVAARAPEPAPLPVAAPPPATESASPVVNAVPVAAPPAVAQPLPAPPALAMAAPPVLAVTAPPAGVLAPDPAPVIASREEPRPRDIHVGDVNHVTIGSVHLGDVVQVQQQLALLQYMQLLALTPGARVAAPGVGFAPAAPTPRRGGPRRPAPFSTSLTDPNNPWGFDFPPTVLAK